MSARRATLAATVAVVALAGCGGGGGTSSGAGSGGLGALPGETGQHPPSSAPSVPGGTLHLHGDPSGALRFNVKSLAVRAGKVTLVMSNPSSLTHSIAIEGNGVSAAGPVVTNGGNSTASANLKPGTYTFFCTVPGHREAGMQGTLTVK